jgi:hypothetical protein
VPSGQGSWGAPHPCGFTGRARARSLTILRGRDSRVLKSSGSQSPITCVTRLLQHEGLTSGPSSAGWSRNLVTCRLTPPVSAHATAHEACRGGRRTFIAPPSAPVRSHPLRIISSVCVLTVPACAHVTVVIFHARASSGEARPCLIWGLPPARPRPPALAASHWGHFLTFYLCDFTVVAVTGVRRRPRARTADHALASQKCRRSQPHVFESQHFSFFNDHYYEPRLIRPAQRAPSRGRTPHGA